jgi:ElaB/YqjD/DUF883 family membrane-anchored ribosome-binding protein
MERNADERSGAAGGMGTGGTAGYGNSGDVSGSSSFAGASGAGSSTIGTGASSTGGTDSAGIADRARGVAGTAKEKLSNVGSTVREQAGTAKDKLADALESGADKLRRRAGASDLAAETGSTSVAVTGDNRMNQVSDKVATGMQRSADWLRDADLDSMREGVERQVKEHPGRTLLIAVGLGYLLGKAFRK